MSISLLKNQKELDINSSHSNDLENRITLNQHFFILHVDF